MNCPVSKEWNELKARIGEDLAYRVYAIANEVPSNVEEIVNNLKASFGGSMEINRSYSNEDDKFKKINANVSEARANLPTYFQNLITKSNLKKMSEGYSSDGTTITHTSVGGMIDKLKTSEYLPLEERVAKQAETFWKDKDPSETRNVNDAGENKPMNKQEFIDYMINREKQYTVRGSLFDLAVQYALSPSLDDKARIDKEFKDVASTISGRYADPKYYNWIYSKADNVGAIIDRLNLNIMDDPTEPDKFALQPVLFNDILKVAGTPDVMVSHGNHEYSIIDLKSGFQFNRDLSSILLDFGRSFSRDIYQNPRDLAHLQLTWYAFLTKLEDPKASFKNLKIAWITDKDSLNDPTEFKAYTDLENNLPVIEKFLRSKPEYKDALETILKDNPRIFEPSYYRTIASEAERLIAKSEGDKALEKLTAEVAYLNMYKNSPLGDSMKEEIAGQDGLLKNYLKLTPDNIEKIVSFNTVEDLSFGEYFTGSVHNIKNPYIKVYQNIVDTQFSKVQADVASKLYPFKDLAKELYIHYMRNRDQNVVNALLSTPSRSIVGFGTGASKILNRLDHNDMWGWAYVNDIRDGEEVPRLVLTEAELVENAKTFKWLLKDGKPHPAAMKILQLVNSTYAEILSPDDPNSLWNKKAAVYTDSNGKERYKIEGEIMNSTIQRKKSPFGYYDGWFAKAPKMAEELGSIFNPANFKNVWRHYFTNFNEFHFDELRSTEELIPIRGLGSRYIDSSRNYSISLEHQFEYFLKSAMMKKHMSQAYAVGQAIRYRINSDKELNELGKPNLARLDQWLELQMERLLRNRVADIPPIFSRAIPFKFGKNDLDEAKNFDLKQTINTMGGLTAKVLLGGKIFGGLKNQIFINMYGLKEAVKNDILVEMGKKAKFPGVIGEYANFDITGLVKGSGQYFKSQKDAMQGNLNKNKLWILANKHAFTPSISPWWSEKRLMTTGKDSLLSEDLWYLPWSVGEEQFSNSVYFAMLDYMKIDKPGHEFHGKSIWDMYEKYDAVDNATGLTYTDYKWRDDPKTGKPFVRAIVIDEADNKQELTDLTQKELSYMYALYEKMQGGYHPMQRTILETNAFGQLFMQFHRYLPAILRNNFSSYGMNYTEGKYLLRGREEDGTPITKWTPRMTEGRYQTMLGVFLEYSKLSSLVKRDNKFSNAISTIIPTNARSYKWEDLSEAQKETLVDAGVTAVFMTILRLLHYLAFAGSDKDKLNKWAQQILDNFIQQWDVTQLADDFSKGPAALTTMFRLIQGSADLSEALLWYTLPQGVEDFLEDKDLMKDYDSDSNWKRIKKDAKTLPYGSAIEDTNERLLELFDDE